MQTVGYQYPNATHQRESTTMTAYTHWPLFGRSLRSECKPLGGIAAPHGAITCPQCRAMLQNKVDAHMAEAAAHKAGTQEAKFFAADAASWQSVLDRAA